MGWRGAWLGALLLGLTASAARGTTDVDQIVHKVQQCYDDTRDFTAEVTQEMTIASLGKTTRARGTVAFKKSGRMRWELDHDAPQIIVADGTTLWLYQPKEHQVLKTPFDEAFRSTMPISFLTGVGRIAEDFDVSMDGESGDAIVLKLLPRRDRESVGQLRLTVARDSGEIRAAEITDPFGNVSRMQFDHLQRNTGLPDDQFVFKVPPGVDVISAPAAQ
jgi:outer membrane lipoprotein carrier protein